MIDGELFEQLEAVARHVRRSAQPFGGLQLVLTGDFHQLPPVAKGRQAAACEPAAIPCSCLHACT
jgi:ATP-dependent DNA helicase PIF1